MRRQKALFVLPTDKMGGAEKIVRLMALQALSTGDHQVEVAVIAGARSGSLDGLLEDAETRLWYSGSTSEGVGVLRFLWHVRGLRCDVVFSSHTHMNALLSLLRRLGWIRTRRLVCRESTMIFQRDLGFAGLLFRWAYAFYGAQDLIICQTSRMAQALVDNVRRSLGGKIRVVPNPVTLVLPSESLSTEAASEAFILVWCGRLVPVKRPERAVEVLAALKKLHAGPVRLRMLGDGPLRPVCEALAARLGCTADIHWYGHVATPSEFMVDADAGLVTSETEGFPNVLLEMASHGLPVVTTDCAGDLQDVPGTTVVTWTDAPAFAECLKESAGQRVPASTIREFLERRDPHSFWKVITDG
jgi:glycosyltransferase involved in cell wall biosynthesis